MLLSTDKYSLFESVVVGGNGHTMDSAISYSDFIYEANLIESAIYDTFNIMARTRSYAILEAAGEADPVTFSVDGKEVNNNKLKQLLINLKNLIIRLFKTIKDKIADLYDKAASFFRAKKKFLISGEVEVNSQAYSNIKEVVNEMDSADSEEKIDGLLNKLKTGLGDAGNTIKVKGSELLGLLEKIQSKIRNAKSERDAMRKADQAKNPEDVTKVKSFTNKAHALMAALTRICGGIIAKLKSITNKEGGEANA